MYFLAEAVYTPTANAPSTKVAARAGRRHHRRIHLPHPPQGPIAGTSDILLTAASTSSPVTLLIAVLIFTGVPSFRVPAVLGVTLVVITVLGPRFLWGP